PPPRISPLSLHDALPISTAIWWAAFTIPLLRRVPEPRIAADAHGGAPLTFRAAVSRLGSTFRTLSRHRQATLMLIAFLLYNDGIDRKSTRLNSSHGSISY